MTDYDEIYRTDTAPWEIGGPQPALAAVLDSAVRGPKVLDAGCGTGELALTLARRGFEVTGVDLSPVAIDRARAKAAAAGLTVHFEVQDATKLSLPAASFDTLIDSGLLHNLHRHNRDQADAYLAGLAAVAAPGASLIVLAVSAAEGRGWSLTEELLRAAFAEPAWAGTRIEDTTVAAEVGGEAYSLRGFLLRTTRG